MNTYFQFKQFTVHQEKCAMKVCTDSCLFGGYIASEIQYSILNIKNILDIGAGTGLLSLMLAQKTDTKIDSIEIDNDASKQAKNNFEESLWSDRLTVFHTDALNFFSDKKYDLIISNPPFFEDDLRSHYLEKNNAKHNTALTLKKLIEIISRHISEEGIFSILLPYHRTDYFITEAGRYGFRLYNKLLIRQTPTHTYFRSILTFSKTIMKLSEGEITIKNSNDQYSDEFISLLKDYYLNF